VCGACGNQATAAPPPAVAALSPPPAVAPPPPPAVAPPPAASGDCCSECGNDGGVQCTSGLIDVKEDFAPAAGEVIDGNTPTCAARIQWCRDWSGSVAACAGFTNQAKSCAQVADEFPDVCGACGNQATAAPPPAVAALSPPPAVAPPPPPAVAPPPAASGDCCSECGNDGGVQCTSGLIDVKEDFAPAAGEVIDGNTPTCSARIQWCRDWSGSVAACAGFTNHAKSCAQVADEFPDVCGACGNQALDGRRLDVTIDPLADCTDGDATDESSGTPCIAYAEERPWIMFALSAQNDRLYSARLILMPPQPPIPPSAPPAPPPRPPPRRPPPPPPSESPSPPPPPPPPYSRPLKCSGKWDRDECVFGLVSYARNGLCEDGGAGSVSSKCEFSSDLSDCGSRGCGDGPPSPPPPAPPPPPPSPPPVPSPPFELGGCPDDFKDTLKFVCPSDGYTPCGTLTQPGCQQEDADAMCRLQCCSPDATSNGWSVDRSGRHQRRGPTFLACHRYNSDGNWADTGGYPYGTVFGVDNVWQHPNIEMVDWSSNTITSNDCACPGGASGRRLQTYGDATEPTFGEAGTAGGAVETSEAPRYDAPGWLEIWVSRSAALWGTRAATIDTSKMVGNEITVRLAEGHEALADGRYVYLRSFNSDQRLRIDGLKIYAQKSSDASRQLEENDFQVHEEPEEPEEPHPQDPGPTKGAPGTGRFSWTRVWRMRNLTAEVCQFSVERPQEAREARVAAAQLWAELGERESEVACTNCTSRATANCTRWFMQLRGLGLGKEYEKAARAQRQRNRRTMEDVRAGSEERIRIMREALGGSCCKVDLKTGAKVCGEQHCKKVFKAKSDARMAHTLRRMHEREGPTNLNVPQLVATDILAPHLHADERCRDVHSRHKHGDVECLALSLTSHLAKKHGFDRAELDRKLSVYGASISSMLTSHLKHQGRSKGSTSESRMSQFRSDARAAEGGAAHRRGARIRRRAEDADVEATGPKPRGPRGGWVSRSTDEARRRLGEGTDLVRVGVEPAGRTLLAQQQIDTMVRNHSLHAKHILRKANLGAASSGSRALTAGTIFSAAWDASISTDSSVFGRARSVFVGVARIAERVEDIRREYGRAQQAPSPPGPEWAGRRRLRVHEHSAYDQVDARVGRTDLGWGPPESHTARWGWVTDSLDWVGHYTEAKRVVGVLSERTEARIRHLEETGTLPAGELRREHKTGWAMLDLNSPPSRLGEALRGLLPHTASVGRRRLGEGYAQKLRDAARAGVGIPETTHVARSVLGSFIDASIEGDDPFAAARHALQRRDHRSRIRRLGEGFLGGASSVLPLSEGSSVSGVPSSLDAGKELTRSLLFDTALVSPSPPLAPLPPLAPSPPLAPPPSNTLARVRSVTCTTSLVGPAATAAARTATARGCTRTTAHTCASRRRRTPCHACRRSARLWACPTTTTGTRSSTRRCATRQRSGPS
jgi:hypothetical protein